MLRVAVTMSMAAGLVEGTVYSAGTMSMDGKKYTATDSAPPPPPPKKGDATSGVVNGEGGLFAGDLKGAGWGPTSAGLTHGAYSEGGGAWGDLVNPTFVDVPKWLLFVTQMTPGHRLKEKTLISFECPSKASVFTHEVKMCDAFVFLYRCPPCVTERGNLEQHLIADDWVMTSCGPKFKTGVTDGVAHNMITLRKQHAPGTTITFTTPDAVIDYVTFGSSSFGVACSKQDNVADCNDAADDHHEACKWNAAAGTCDHTNYCPRMVGPFGGGGGGGGGGKLNAPGCKVCPNDELPDGHPLATP